MVLVKEAARLFNSKELAAVANGDFSFLLKVASRYSNSLGDTFLAREVFEHCYRDFEKNYKNEYFFKNIVASKVLLGRHSLRTATMLNEFRVGLNKADCVILNGASTCYEIKSEYDSLARLPEQLDSYLRLFDRVSVVTTENHLSKVQATVPDAVGIFKLSARGSLSEVKPADVSDREVDVEILMSSLRKKEYLMLVEHIFGEVPVIYNGSTYDACKDLLATVDSIILREAFCSVLKETRKIDSGFVGALPSNLLAAGIEYKFSAAGRTGLVNNLSAIFSKEAICTVQFFGENAMS